MRNSPNRGFSFPFRIPNIVGRLYAPGPQPNAPGESVVPYNNFYHGIPWPNAVPSINALANFAGQARDWPIQSVNNAVATLPEQYLYIGGYSEKSKG